MKALRNGKGHFCAQQHKWVFPLGQTIENIMVFQIFLNFVAVHHLMNNLAFFAAPQPPDWSNQPESALQHQQISPAASYIIGQAHRRV